MGFGFAPKKSLFQKESTSLRISSLPPVNSAMKPGSVNQYILLYHLEKVLSVPDTLYVSVGQRGPRRSRREPPSCLEGMANLWSSLARKVYPIDSRRGSGRTYLRCPIRAASERKEPACREAYPVLQYSSAARLPGRKSSLHQVYATRPEFNGSPLLRLLR